MRRVLFFLMISMAMVMSSCVQPDEPTEKRFSVLGDSFSSLKGTVDPESNDVWIYDSVGVTSPEQMWWHKVALKMGWVLEKNNSFSGSLICNLNAGDYYGPYSFIRRMDNLGDPDVILVFGGTNDVWNGAEFGDFVYADWTEEQLCQIRPAMAYLFENLKRLYPRADLYFLLDTDMCPGGIDEVTMQKFIESTHSLTRHYGVNCIDLPEIHKKWWHPDEKGQADIARQVIEALQVDFNV